MPLNADDCVSLDQTLSAGGGLQDWRARFAPGAPGVTYFDANSIGPMPLAAPGRMAEVLDTGWRQARRRGWSELDWLDQPRALGSAISHLLGAEPEDVRVCDSTSLNQYKLLRHALSIAAPRRVIVLERDVFPSNSHVAQGIARAGPFIGQHHHRFQGVFHLLRDHDPK